MELIDLSLTLKSNYNTTEPHTHTLSGSSPMIVQSFDSTVPTEKSEPQSSSNKAH